MSLALGDFLGLFLWLSCAVQVECQRTLPGPQKRETTKREKPNMKTNSCRNDYHACMKVHVISLHVTEFHVLFFQCNHARMRGTQAYMTHETACMHDHETMHA